MSEGLKDRKVEEGVWAHLRVDRSLGWGVPLLWSLLLYEELGQ